MRIFITLILLTLSIFGPTFVAAEAMQFDDGPWIAIPAGYDAAPMMSPQEEIHAMANLDGNPNITTPDEIKMIALLTQMLGATPASQ